MINFYSNANCCKPTVKITDTGSLSTYQKLCYVLDKIEEIIDFVNTFQANLDKKEDSVNITNSRKLSETANFTGTWNGDSKQNIDQLIIEGLNNYTTLYNYLIANPQLSYIIWDSKFFTTVESAGVELDGGLFGDSDTEETDGGLFVYSCACLN